MNCFRSGLLRGSRVFRAGVRWQSSAQKRETPMLDRPIGVLEPPKSTDNTGIDSRTLKQKKDDLMDYDKHMEKRRELEAEYMKGFDEVRHFRSTKGKFWMAPSAYFRADKALYMPNFWGRTLLGEWAPTTSVLKGKVSVVRVFGSVSGEWHVNSFTQNLVNERLTEPHKRDFQIVDINLPDTRVKEYIVKMFLWNVKRSIQDPARHGTYFLSRKGVTKQMKKAIRADNAYSGFVYLVDRHCRIRWAGSGDATENEKKYLDKFLSSVIKERH
jgi:ATPase complex subunit ATP10